jgi:hypothetical protein
VTRTTKLPVRWATATAAALTAAVALAPAPAGATEREAITITDGQTFEKSYDRIPASDPATDSTAPTPPETCRVSPACALFAVKIVVPPSYTANDDFFVRVILSWDREELPAGESSNDLDLYLWEAGAKAPIDKNGGAGSGMPETSSFDNPRKNDYFIVVDNDGGVNTGFRLKLQWLDGRSGNPFESLDPAFDNGEGRPVDLSGDAPVEVTEAPKVSDPAPAAAEILSGGDESVYTGPVGEIDDFLPAAAAGGLDDVSAGELLGARDARLAPPGPASGIQLIIALIVVPALLAAAGAFWFLKNRPPALSFGAPAGGGAGA